MTQSETPNGIAAKAPQAESGIDATAWRDHLKGLGGTSFLNDLCRQACKRVMEFYVKPIIKEVEKDNGSPLTEADLASAALIERILRDESGLPVICEESVAGVAAPQGMYWLVDPLDGTKEFINRNGEFTVNIALVSNGEPVAGVIGVPATEDLFVAVQGEGAFQVQGNRIQKIENKRRNKELVAAISRSHAASALVGYLEACGIYHAIERGSALKFCELARGTCDVYVRIGRTMEWDTAAGQILLEEAGCQLLVAYDGARLGYGKHDHANPSFIASRRGINLPCYLG